MFDFVGIFAGFILGIVASWLFWQWQLLIKPKFKVSSKLAVAPSKNDPAKSVYKIKIVNMSARPIINMHASLNIDELRENSIGPQRPTVHKLRLNPATDTIIGPRVRHFDPWSITNTHYYTSIVDSEVEELLKDKNRRLVFTIQATDASSGTTVIRRFTYTTLDLERGHFEPRDSFKIIPFESDSTHKKSIRRAKSKKR